MSASEEHPKPDHSDAGGDRDIGQGYPEEQQPGANPDDVSEHRPGSESEETEETEGQG